jgi:fructose/tagatose bisphosphate aldolase
MPYPDLTSLLTGVTPALRLHPDGVEILDAARLRDGIIDQLIYTVVFGPEELRPAARWIIRMAAPAAGAFPASIHELYLAAGRGEYSNATAPAINIRGLTFDQSAAIFRAAMQSDAKIVLFELARSEMSYTWQRPGEYASAVLAGAIKAGWHGPVFIQGDHYQFVARQYRADAAAETSKLQDLTREAIDAGYYNIDIDASTLVDLERPSLLEQQEINYRLTAEMTALIRAHEPDGITVSIGGEIGEVGARNSTVEDLDAFMTGYVPELERLGAAKGENLEGISKISVQTGTSHGGVVLPDGTMADVAVDFDTLRDLSTAARERWGLGGAVQHGASTLPETAFGKFAEANAIEVHLATAFQNILFDHPSFPAELKTRMYAHLAEKSADERKPGQTDAQFYYTTRKRAYGPFKRELWDLSEAARESILASLGESYANIMRRLGVGDTAAIVDRVVQRVDVSVAAPPVLTAALAGQAAR